MNNDEFRNDRNECENGGETRLRNKAELEFDLCGKKHEVESESRLELIKVKVKQEQSCDFCVEGDEIEYKIRLDNDSDVNLHDCVFKDFLPRGTEFIKHSFKVNGKKADADIDDRRITFRIGELKKHEELTITFEVKVK